MPLTNKGRRKHFWQKEEEKKGNLVLDIMGLMYYWYLYNKVEQAAELYLELRLDLD